jgi:hypothetical protein
VRQRDDPGRDQEHPRHFPILRAFTRMGWFADCAHVTRNSRHFSFLWSHTTS